MNIKRFEGGGEEGGRENLMEIPKVVGDIGQMRGPLDLEVPKVLSGERSFVEIESGQLVSPNAERLLAGLDSIDYRDGEIYFKTGNKQTVDDFIKGYEQLHKDFQAGNVVGDDWDIRLGKLYGYSDADIAYYLSHLKAIEVGIPEVAPKVVEAEEENKENQKEGCSEMTEEIQREPWEMTQREIIDQARKTKGWSTKTNAGWRSKTFTGVVSEHRAAIKEALKEGKPVPQEVLNDYPELLKPEVDVKRGDHVVVQGLKDTYEGMVTSVQDNTFWLSTPQFVKMKWTKGDIIEIIPGEETKEVNGGSEPKSSRIQHHSEASAGYLE